MLPSHAFACVFAILCLVPCGGSTSGQDDDAYRRDRERMVERYVVREKITNEAVLRAMREVPRHLFVPPEQLTLAYYDLALPIGYKQTISSPYIVGYMTAVLDPKPEDRVLEIGTGSGYQAAVLSRIVKDVYTIEIVEPLGKSAAERLRELDFHNIHAKIGDGYQGWPENAPFDKIIVTCSPENVPRFLADQLREGGRMVIPLGERYQQTFYVLEKHQGRLSKTRLVPTLFVPMTGAAEEERKKRSDPSRPVLVNGGFENETEGVLDGWFYQRQAALVRSGAREGTAYLLFSNREPGRLSGISQGLGIDGARVKSLILSLSAKADRTRAGKEPNELPGLIIQFYDAESEQLESAHLGPWLGTFGWRRVSGEIRVPPKAQAAVIRIGLNGAVGSLSVDDVRLTTPTSHPPSSAPPKGGGG